MARSGIYKITNPKGKIYIGQSVNVDHRIYQYKRLSNCIEQRLLYASFKKHGIENHSFEIIELCDLSLLNERESYYFELYDVQNREKGLNIRNAGSRGSHSPETIAKMKAKQKNKKLTPEHCEKMRQRGIENPINFWLGKTRSKEDRKKMSDSHKGKTGMNHPRSKKIYQCDLNGNVIKEFHGISEAARELGFKRSGIKEMLRGNIKTYKKHIWKYGREHSKNNHKSNL